MSIIYARLINQYKFKCQTVFSARFDKQNDDNQISDEIDLFIKLKTNNNLTESAINNNNI